MFFLFSEKKGKKLVFLSQKLTILYENFVHMDTELYKLILKPPLNKSNFSTFFGLIEPRKFDFSFKPMRMPIIAIWGLEMAKKGISIAFVSVDIFQILKFGSCLMLDTSDIYIICYPECQRIEPTTVFVPAILL